MGIVIWESLPTPVNNFGGVNQKSAKKLQFASENKEPIYTYLLLFFL